MAVESAHYGGHSVIFYILEKRIYGMPDAKGTVEVPYDKSFVLPHLPSYTNPREVQWHAIPAREEIVAFVCDMHYEGIGGFDETVTGPYFLASGTFDLPYGVDPSPILWDLFISHASEDKDEFARPLAVLLRQHGLKVWFDEFSLTPGDSLRESIDRGLRSSTFGVVVISPAFCAKAWMKLELNALLGLAAEGQVRLLPIWHKVTLAEVHKLSPLLADKIALDSRAGLDATAASLIHAVQGPRRASTGGVS